MAHATACRIGHFAILDMKSRLAKQIAITRMVIMKMSDDDI